MKKTVNKLANCTVEVLCVFEEAEWKEAQEKAFKKLAKNVEIKGFRKGQAPDNMVRGKVSQGQILETAVNDSLQPTYESILNEEKLIPFARPTVDVTKVSDTECEVKFTLVLPPEVTLGDYKGLNVEVEPAIVEEKEIDDAITSLAAQNASLVVVEREAKKGDTVVLDFTGYVDGKEFDGGKGENYSLELGSNSFIPGFEDQLVGTKAGDSKDVNVTFPTQYVPELAGKDATFKCVVHEVKEKVIPEIDEELVKDLNIPNVKTVEDLRAQQKSNLEENKKNASRNKALNTIIDKICENSTVEFSKTIVDNEVASMKENMNQQVAQRGMTMDQYLSIVGKTMEDYEKELAVQAEKNLKGYLVLEKVAEVENIEVDEKDCDFEMAKIAEQYNMPLDQVKDILGKDMARFKNQIKQKRIEDFLINNNTK